jgi:3-deoxy-7-phosphoheptulonate synthase
VVTEALDPDAVELVAEYADIIQIGARNMQNYSLLKEAGRAGKPVLLKRGISATLREWLLAAEYVMVEGESRVILCERGVRGFDDHSRYTFDLNVVPSAKEESHLPVIADPSHGTGVRSKVLPMARAAIAAGADGLLVEVHPDPASALSDGAQSLTPGQFEVLMTELDPIIQSIGRRFVRELSSGDGEVRETEAGERAGAVS